MAKQRKSAYSKFDDERSVAKSIIPKVEGKLRTRRILLVLLYVAYVALWVVILGITRAVPLGAVSLVTLCILIFFTWRFAKVEYELTIHMGELGFAVIYGGLNRKDLFSCHIRDLKIIAPYNASPDARREADDTPADERLVFVSDLNSEDNYYAVSESPEGKRTLVIFETEEKSRKMLKYYNSSAFKG